MLTVSDISEIFNLQLEAVLRLFTQGEINVPSKLNKKK
jgi:hypothetical protein